MSKDLRMTQRSAFSHHISVACSHEKSEVIRGVVPSARLRDFQCLWAEDSRGMETDSGNHRHSKHDGRSCPVPFYLVGLNEPLSELWISGSVKSVSREADSQSVGWRIIAASINEPLYYMLH